MLEKKMVAGGPLPMREGVVHNIPLRKRKAQQRECVDPVERVAILPKHPS